MTFEGITAQPNTGLPLVHTTQPSVDEVEFSRSSGEYRSRSAEVAAAEAAGGLQVQVFVCVRVGWWVGG